MKQNLIIHSKITGSHKDFDNETALHFLFISVSNFNFAFYYLATTKQAACVSKQATRGPMVNTARYTDFGDPTFALATIAPVMISRATKSYNEGRAANLSLSKQVLLSLKKHILRWKKVFLRAERASRARSAKSFRPGSRARLRALEAHGFRCSLVQS